VTETVRRYLGELPQVGIHPRCAVLFGSAARGDAGPESDLDLVVVAPEFDGPYDMCLVKAMWRVRAWTDSRIEPVSCGEREWETEHGRRILDIARSEGIVIDA
jgi:hypothetical protein